MIYRERKQQSPHNMVRQCRIDKFVMRESDSKYLCRFHKADKKWSSICVGCRSFAPRKED